jgi:hypothetical protein
LDILGSGAAAESFAEGDFCRGMQGLELDYLKPDSQNVG